MTWHFSVLWTSFWWFLWKSTELLNFPRISVYEACTSLSCSLHLFHVYSVQTLSTVLLIIPPLLVPKKVTRWADWKELGLKSGRGEGKLKAGQSGSGWPGGFERCWLRFLSPDIIHAFWKCTFLVLKIVSRMRSCRFWSQFVCDIFLLEVQKKAASSPEGQIFMQPAGTLQQYGIKFLPKLKPISGLVIPKLRNKNCMHVHDDKMVCFSVQNQSRVPPIYSKGNLCTMSGHLTSFLFLLMPACCFHLLYLT